MKYGSALKKIIVLLVIFGAAGAAYAYRNVVFWAVTSIRIPGTESAAPGLLRQDLQANEMKVVASGLRVPVEIGFLPDGALLAIEREGKLVRVASDSSVTEIPVEGGGEGYELLGMAVHPRFAENRWLYLYTTSKGPQGLRGRVDRYVLDGDRLRDSTTIIQNIPAAAFAEGGEIAFGPDGKLYVTTGDAGQPSLAQDLKSLAGKILRLDDSGGIPSNNPFGSAVWTYGHRNPQGLAWDRKGQLWETEHGRSGVRSGYDEVNLIEGGRNYGWPVIQGSETAEDMMSPVIESGPNDAWAPAGAAFINDSIFFGGLRGEALYQARPDHDPAGLQANFEHEFGRIRAVSVGPDGYLYFTTSNWDGRGIPKDGDDQIIRVSTRLFHTS